MFETISAIIAGILSIAIIASLAIVALFFGGQAYDASAEARSSYAEKNAWEAPANPRTSKERSWSSSGEFIDCSNNIYI